MEEMFEVSPDIRGHCSRVAELADAIGEALVGAKIAVDLAAVHAGAGLHDLAKGQTDHDMEGARLLGEMGFAKIGSLVAAHQDLSAGESPSSPTLEAKIVYLADKLVIGTATVRLEERFEAALNRFGSDPASRAGVQRRFEQAVGVRKEIESLLGRPVEEVIPG
jgi:HD superfamily phosphodiesterase